MFRAVDLILIPFSLFWLAIVLAFGWFTLEQASSGPETGARTAMLALCGAFLLAGFYMLIGRHLADALRRASTYYAVTDRRAVIVHASWPRAVRSIDLQHLPSLRLDESSEGRGTIESYDTASFTKGNRTGVWHPTIGQPPKLFEIEKAKSVFEFIGKAAAAESNHPLSRREGCRP